MPREIVHPEHRDKLFARVQEDPKFRQMLKKDWREAFAEMEIDPEKVIGGRLTREEMATFAQQRAAWTITIVISARSGIDQIAINEAVNFEARR